MEFQGLYAALRVRDLDAATAFFTKLMGREPDDRPMDTLVQWRPLPHAGIQLFAAGDDAGEPGQGTMTLVVPDMDATKQALATQGIDIGALQQGDFGRIARFKDPDGNDIVLAEPPRPK